MKTDWAAEQLQTIRTLMERSALYRRALAPVMTLAGGLALAAGGLGFALRLEGARWFAGYWLGVAVLGLIASLLLIRRQAFKAAEPLWSPPTRRVAQALALPFCAGAVFSVLFLFTADEQEECASLISLWLLFYAFALNAAGFFVRRGIRLFGWLIAACSFALLLLHSAGDGEGWGLARQPYLLMGGLFGAPHLLYGIYLYFTEQSS